MHKLLSSIVDRQARKVHSVLRSCQPSWAGSAICLLAMSPVATTRRIFGTWHVGRQYIVMKRSMPNAGTPASGRPIQPPMSQSSRLSSMPNARMLINAENRQCNDTERLKACRSSRLAVAMVSVIDKSA